MVVCKCDVWKASVEFWSNVQFPTYLVNPASYLSGENLAPICAMLEF